jgi:coenzyme F420-dependent glucose-6-phosphate dehydrogenase
MARVGCPIGRPASTRITMHFSYHVSHEQFTPRELLELTQQAEAAGFEGAFCSDHLHPWGAAQGESGFSWSWLGAALQATRRLTFATITVPGAWRYHPAIVAQAFATLAQMFPGRLPWVALGSGEALNERVVGAEWPSKQERNLRLEEAAGIIRRLFAGERVTSRGRIICEGAQVWSLPKRPVRLFGAAMSEGTARAVGKWADGLLTTSLCVRRLEAIAAAFKSVAGEKPMHLKVDLSWAPTEEEALDQAHRQWRFLAPGRRATENFVTPEEFEKAAASVQPEDMRASVLVSADLDQHVEWLRERIALGFEALDLHNVGRNQRDFIEVFSRRVLPALRSPV